MPFSRASGILLHPTSFPSRFGIGDLGPTAYQFIDFLERSNQRLWQILPLGPTGYGNSPYMCYSAMAGNPLLISLEQLRDDKLLTDEDLANFPELALTPIDFAQVEHLKLPLLQKAHANFQTQATPEQQQEFQEFCDRAAYWLDDYALFITLKNQVYNGANWNEWDPEIAQRDPQALAIWRDKLKDDLLCCQYLQFEFFRQWVALKDYANEHHIQILGDIPIYVAHDSADVWSHPEIFCLDDETGKPALMAGVPPDYFSATGQLWGNPVYNWEQLQKTDFSWWMQRFRAILDLVDLIRIDHFRGFQAYWAVPGDEETAINGEWIEAPGDALFTQLETELGNLPIIAEDLGIITPEVEELRDKFGFPGMKILQFAFDSGKENPYLPFNYHSPNCVVYTGTHDNDTTLGWYEQRSHEANQRVWDYLGCSRGEGINWDLIRLALATNANTAIFPLQDILGLGTECRMNAPGVAEGNWGWRYHPDALLEDLGDRLSWYTQVYGRA